MRRLRFLLPLLFLLLPSLLGAEGFSGWQQSSTKHFVFVYEKRDRSVVVELRSFAEQVYSEITSFFGSYPKKIWVVVDGRIDTANGYYIGGTVPSHLVLYVTSPSVPILGSKERQYLRLLLTHELTHYVHLNYNRGFFAVLSDIFGPGVKPADSVFMPDWMKEGIAVNNETAFTEGGRGRDPFFAMEGRALLLDNKFFSLRQAAYGSAFPPQDRVYLGGYLFVHYLLERFGHDTFARIQRRFARFPLFGPWAAIKAVTGHSAEKLYRDMLRKLRRQYARYARIPAGELVSPDRIGDYFLPVVTDRGWYEYRSNLDSAPAIVRVDPSSGKEHVLVDTSLTDYTSLTADRSGNRIVYASFDVTLGPAGTIATSDLFSIDPSTHQVRRITNGKHLWQPALSPDGKTLVAVQRSESFSRLVVVAQGTGTVRPLFSLRGTNVFNPAFSPNGKLLTFALNDHGRQRIMVLDLAKALGSVAAAPGARPLPDVPGKNTFFPRFTDDSHIVFVADLGGGLALYEEAVAGGKLYRIADDPVGVSSGLLDGDTVVYTSYSKNGTVVREKPAEHVAVPRSGSESGAPRPIHETVGTVLGAGGSSSENASSPATTDRRAEDAMHGRRYVDWPRPVFWLPLPFYDYLPANTTGVPTGFGAILYGASVLERNAFALGLSFRTDILQPSLNLATSWAIGKSSLDYTLAAGYSAITLPAYEQTVTQSLALTVPVVAENILGETTLLSLTPGLSDALSIRSGQPFPFYAPISTPSAFLFGNQYSFDLGLSYSRARDGAPRDIYSPHDTELSIQGSYAPNQTSLGGLTSTFAGSISVPSFFPNQAVRFGIKTSYSTVPVTGPTSTAIRPRGFFLSLGNTGDPVYEQTTPARTIVAADYLFNLSLLDAPLPLGLNIQGIAMGLHLAAGADWNPQAGIFEPDRSIYAGAEVVALFGYQAGGSPLPVGFGVSVRFDPTFARPFDPLHDIGPYIFFGTNSFLSAALTPTAALASSARRSALASPRVDF